MIGEVIQNIDVALMLTIGAGVLAANLVMFFLGVFIQIIVEICR